MRDTVELIMGSKKKEFDIQIPDDQAENIATVGQAISYIEEAKKIIHLHLQLTLLIVGCYFYISLIVFQSMPV